MGGDKPPIVLSVNQDAGIDPQRAKGAAVHLGAMRDAFAAQGVRCLAIDEADDSCLLNTLEKSHEQQTSGLIYERYALGKSTTARFAVRNKIPFVLEVNAPLADEQRRWRGGSDEDTDTRHDAFTMAHADKVIAVSSDVARYAIACGASPERVEVFPNGIDTQRFRYSARELTVRGKLFPADRFVIGFHGRLRPWHGFDLLVDVVLGLIERNLDIHLLAVGEGDFRDLKRLPVERYSRVEWQPHREVPRYVAACDALPLTYQADMPCYFSPLKLMEAMACGVVPLVPELGDLPVTVNHLQTGMVYRAGDKKELQQFLERLITTQELRQTLGRQAAEEARKHSWNRIAKHVLAVMTGAAQSASRSA